MAFPFCSERPIYSTSQKLNWWADSSHYGIDFVTYEIVSVSRSVSQIPAREFLFKCVCHVRREYAVRQFGIRVFLDSMLIESLYGYAALLMRNPALFKDSRARLITRRINAVERFFHVRFVACTYFPPDLLWQDYFQIDSFKPRRNSQVIDIGANVGDWTVVVGKHFGAKVVAIEPVATAIELLQRNVRLNSLETSVRILNCALGESVGTVNLVIDALTGYAQSIDPPDSTKGGYYKANCPLDTLDNITSRLAIDAVDIIKIDVDGAEMNVLKRSNATINKFEPKVIVEVHTKQLRQSVMRYFQALDYKLVFEKVNFWNSISVLYLEPVQIESTA